jgi:uncharacterized membrane protein YeaQ/YmgE (transglycosylase-associated protein family)
MIWFILVLFVFGIIFGAIARLLVPGRDPIGIVGTWALGVAGSFMGGFLGYLIFGGRPRRRPVPDERHLRIHHRSGRAPVALPGRRRQPPTRRLIPPRTPRPRVEGASGRTARPRSGAPWARGRGA